MKKKQLGRRRRQGTSQPRSCQLGQFHCIGQFPGQYRRWCQVCDDHSVGPGIHRYESCRGVTCQEVYGQNVEQSSKERVAKEETPDKAPDYKNWGRMSEIIGKQLVAIAGLERYVETPNHAEPSHTEVAASGGSTTGRRCQAGQFLCHIYEVRSCGPCYNHSSVCSISWCQGEVCQYDMEKSSSAKVARKETTDEATDVS